LAGDCGRRLRDFVFIDSKIFDKGSGRDDARQKIKGVAGLFEPDSRRKFFYGKSSPNECEQL
jgi:hypothetical protein